MSNNDPTETNQRKQASKARRRHQGREIQHTGLASAVGVAPLFNNLEKRVSAKADSTEKQISTDLVAKSHDSPQLGRPDVGAMASQEATNQIHFDAPSLEVDLI